MPPPVQLFFTTIASHPKLSDKVLKIYVTPFGGNGLLTRSEEYILRILQVKKIPYDTYDLASDERAKRVWRRKAPAKNQDLPGILVGNVWPGTFEQFEEAVEYDELSIFLRRNEDWNEDVEDDYGLVVKPTGVPGAYRPHEMTGQTPSKAPEGAVPTPAEREGEVDLGEAIPGFGFQGLKVTADEISDLVKSLGLEDGDADDLIGGLDFSTPGLSAKSIQDTNTAQDSGLIKPLSPIVIVSHDTASSDLVQSEDEAESGTRDEPSDTDSEAGPSPRLKLGMSPRKRTDERPLVSPISPSQNSSIASPSIDVVQGVRTQSPVSTPNPSTP